MHFQNVFPFLSVKFLNQPQDRMILGIFRKFIPNKQSFRYALIFTLAVSVLEAILSVDNVPSTRGPGRTYL